MIARHLFSSLLILWTSLAFANPLPAKVNAMGESSRRNLLGLLVRQAGSQCPKVQRTFLQGRLPNAAVWNVACNGRKADFILVLNEDESNTVRLAACAAHKELGVPPCFRKL